MKHEDERMDEYIREKLNQLSHTPPRDPAKAVQTRTSFLAQVKAHSPAPDLSSPVPLSPSLRLKGWINQVLGSFTRKESHRMLQALTALFVIGAMLFGGAGATVYAAQDALPNDALYTLKTATEDLRLAFALDPQSELDLLLNYSDRRMSEVLALSKAGEAIPQAVVVRLNAEMDLLEDIITDLEEPELSEAVEKVQVLIRDRDRISWSEEDDMLRLLATRAWTLVEVDSEVCIDPLYDPLVEGSVCLEYEKICIDPLYDPLVEGSECTLFEMEWVFAQPDPQFRFRNEAAPRNEDARGPEWDEEITDTEIISDTATLSGTGEQQQQGTGSGAGPGGSDDAPVGPGSGQGNATDRGDGGSYKDESKGNTPPEVGYGPYDGNSQYLFLEYFNLPTPKAKGSGGGGKK
jgi:hypothetical protein